MSDADCQPQFDPKAHLAAIIESSEDAIISTNLDGIVTSWNPAAEQMFGWSAREAIGQPMTLIVPEGHWTEDAEMLERIRRGEVVHHFETTRKRKNDALIDISLAVSPIKDASGRHHRRVEDRAGHYRKEEGGDEVP